MNVSAIDISTSGLVACRTRLDAIASNLANMSTIRNEDGENKPYKPRFTIVAPDEDMSTKHGAVGVKVLSVEKEDREPLMKYEPHNPLANDRGMVAYPNIDMTREFTNALVATRAYEANVGVMEVTKNLGQQTLRIVG